MRLSKIALIAVAGIVAAYLVLSIPGKDAPQMRGAGKQAFAWNQNEIWKALEARFRDARSAGCPKTAAEISQRLQEGNRQVAAMTGRQLQPSAFLFDAVESNLFNLGPSDGGLSRTYR